MQKIKIIFLAAVAAALPGISLAKDPGGISSRPPFSMHAKQREWGEACGAPSSNLQSPIQLDAAYFSEDGAASSLKANVAPAELIDTGHTFQVRFTKEQPGSSVLFEGEKFDLRQFHFHKPSEHLLNGKQFEMEAHFVFLNRAEASKKKALVLGFMIFDGADNAEIKKIWTKLPPMKEGYGENSDKLVPWFPHQGSHELLLEHLSQDEKVLAKNLRIDIGRILPRKAEFLVYNGSLTTPPCSEGIVHATSTTPISFGHNQIEHFEGYYEGTNRELQPLGSENTRQFRKATFTIK